MKYLIKARRKDTCEMWSAWGETNDINKIDYFIKMVEDAGYLARLFPGNESMAALWQKFGTRSPIADELYDLGFRLRNHAIYNFKKAILERYADDFEKQEMIREIWRGIK